MYMSEWHYIIATSWAWCDLHDAVFLVACLVILVVGFGFLPQNFGKVMRTYTYMTFVNLNFDWVVVLFAGDGDT